MTDTSNVWIWECSSLDGIDVYDTTEYWDLATLKNAVDASFADFIWEEVERRGIKGTSVLVKQNGRYVDTGHWVYRKSTGPEADAVPDSIEQLQAEYAEAEAAWSAIPGDRPTGARSAAWQRVLKAYDALVDAGVEMEAGED